MAWTVRTTPADGASGYACARSPSLNRVVAVGGVFDPAIVFSVDNGVTWTAADPNDLDGQYATGVCWAVFLDLFVAVGKSVGNRSIILTSADGVSWATQANPWSGVDSTLLGIDSDDDNGLLVAIGRRTSNNFIYLDSPNATAWTEHDITPLTVGYGVKWISDVGLWVAVGDPDAAAEAICTSPDTTTWTGVVSDLDTSRARCVGQLVSGDIIVGGLGTGGKSLVQSSDGGASFTTKTNPFDGGEILGIGVSADVVYLGGYDTTASNVLATSVDDGATYAFESHPFDSSGGSGQLVAFVLSGTTWVSVGQNESITEMVATSGPAPSTRPVIPLWRNFIADLSGQGITDYSKLTSDRAVEVILNGPLSAEGTVPSDNPQVWIPYDGDGYDDPYLNEGTRLMWWFRRESNTPPYYTVRGATMVQLVSDEAQQDDARTRFVGWDPWHYMFSRPVQNYDGTLPGDAGISFTATQAATVIETLLDNTFQNDGHIYIDLPDLKPDASVNSGASGFWSGTIETGAGMSIDINFAQNTSVGQALQQVCNMGVCDIILNPIYDPTNRPNFLVELNVYAQAGVTRDEAIFAWNAPGRSLVGISRTEDGSSRANKMVFFAGQGGASGVTAVTEDAASQAKYGTYFAQQFFPGQVDLTAVTDLVDQQLLLRKNGKTTVMIRPAPERSPRPWQDYQLGDRVPVWALPRGFRQLLGDAI